MQREALKPLTGRTVFTVSSPPHWHCGATIPGMMLDILLALCPAVVMAAAVFGMDAVRVMALSCATAVVVEAACCKAMKRPVSVDDYSALVTGLLFAFLLPAEAPWWLVMAGSAISIALGKMVFGGLGGHPFCPPLVGWAVCRISWKSSMDIDMSLLNADLFYPLTQLKHLGLEAISRFSYADLLLGKQLGGLGAAQTGALLLGGIYLLLRRRIRPDIPLAFLAGTFLLSLAYALSDPSFYAPPLFHLMTGSVVLGAFFLATDCSSSPMGHVPMILFGLLGGALTVIIRVYGDYPDGVPFAIMLANLATPLLDRIRPRPFGGAGRGGRAHA